MAQPSQPPPSRTALAAAAGGFGGAILGVIAATSMMGDGNASNAQSSAQPVDAAVIESQLAAVTPPEKESID
ncbi:MAG TPA: hypothetical protein PKK10_07280 [Woeseiaceae bacterium]|nr:hypothetical protein [Woeseiaceae bacterium]